MKISGVTRLHFQDSKSGLEAGLFGPPHLTEDRDSVSKQELQRKLKNRSIRCGLVDRISSRISE